MHCQHLSSSYVIGFLWSSFFPQTFHVYATGQIRKVVLLVKMFQPKIYIYIRRKIKSVTLLMFQYRRRNSCSTDAQYVTSNKFHCNNISLILTCYFLVVVFRLPSTVMLLLFAVIMDLMVSDVVDSR